MLQDMTLDARLHWLNEKIPQALQTARGDKQAIHTYIILDPAGDARKDIATALNIGSFDLPKHGIFPQNISESVELDNVEPQLMPYTAQTDELLATALKTDVTAIQILYSPLDGQALANQLKNQLIVYDDNTEQTAFWRYWDSRTFIPWAELINTPERQSAVMGNIALIGLIDEESPDKLQIYTLVDKQMTSWKLNPDSEFKDIPNTVIAYTAFEQRMHRTADDAAHIRQVRLNKQIRTMARQLLLTDLAQERGHTELDDVLDGTSKATHYVMKHYHLDDTDAVYSFVLATYTLGDGFEKNESELLVALNNPEVATSDKTLLIDKLIIKFMRKQGMQEI